MHYDGYMLNSRKTSCRETTHITGLPVVIHCRIIPRRTPKVHPSVEWEDNGGIIPSLTKGSFKSTYSKHFQRRMPVNEIIAIINFNSRNLCGRVFHRLEISQPYPFSRFLQEDLSPPTEKCQKIQHGEKITVNFLLCLRGIMHSCSEISNGDASGRFPLNLTNSENSRCYVEQVEWVASNTQNCSIIKLLRSSWVFLGTHILMPFDYRCWLIQLCWARAMWLWNNLDCPWLAKAATSLFSNRRRHVMMN
jgi:hypothetical protein